MTDLRDMLGYDFGHDKRREEAKRKQHKIALELICQGYEEFMGWSKKAGKIPTEITDRYNPTKEQVLEFSRALVRYKDLKDFARYTADYLTALMHSSKDAEFEIDMTGLNKAGITLDRLGYELQGKKLTVNGNAGDWVGRIAQNSQITVNGDAGVSVGYDAKNSQITITGNAGDWVGAGAQNSQITVNGNAGDVVGECAQGSQITINGNAGAFVGGSAKDSQITINGNAGNGVGYVAKDSQIRIKGTYKSLSDEIAEGTEIYQEQNGIWVRVHPK